MGLRSPGVLNGWQTTNNTNSHNFSSTTDKVNQSQQSLQPKQPSDNELTPSTYQPVLPVWLKPVDMWLQKHILETKWVCAYLYTKHCIIAHYNGDLQWTNLLQVAHSRGSLLYSNLDRIEYMDFVTRFNMRDEFLSWFVISELHVWMLMVRAMGETHPVKVRDGLNKLLWQDTIMRMKPLHLERSQIQQSLADYGSAYTYALISYDEGIKDDKVLASALWNRFFLKECENFEHLELLVKYIRLNVRNKYSFFPSFWLVPLQ